VLAVTQGRLSPVLLAVVALVPAAAAEAVAALPGAATQLIRSRAAAHRVVALLDIPAAPTAAVPATGSAQPSATVTASLARPFTLAATALDAGWPGRPLAVQGVDLAIAPGRRVAVVGPSGGGKTTLLLTLAGLLPPRAGRVDLLGAAVAVGHPAAPSAPVDLATLAPALARSAITYTAEDAHVFTTSLRENLRLADPHADDHRLLLALDDAGLRGWVRALPHGLDTVLGEGGNDLSGGERRRLLLARARLSPADVLLLDEPGEHLDPDTADRLVTEMFGAGRSVVVVTHRLPPLHLADEVLIVDGGRISGRGTHEELARSHRWYAAALAAQTGAGASPGGPVPLAAPLDLLPAAALEDPR
jgi:ATP-binding cassette subfamily C protein CydC